MTLILTTDIPSTDQVQLRTEEGSTFPVRPATLVAGVVTIVESFIDAICPAGGTFFSPAFTIPADATLDLAVNPIDMNNGDLATWEVSSGGALHIVWGWQSQGVNGQLRFYVQQSGLFDVHFNATVFQIGP